MESSTIKVSANFKRMTFKAVASILLFIFTYLILIALAIIITILCGYGGIMLITLRPSLITIVLGAGIISMGILISIFLLKFITTKNRDDRSNLVEITKKDEPKLFEFISGLVSDIKTNYPKRIYLSADVNAAVFYDSNFWSMFFPIKKNLLIGMGLVNSISVDEFKAILAHEFGHFSQRSMKVGSYVYNVNRVIYNMLYENDGFDSLAQKWANTSGYIAFFVSVAIKVVHGIQWILSKVYSVVNLSYMGLSREMEFHADEIAANAAGSKPLATALLRLNLIEHAYSSVLNYYEGKIADSIKTENIYPLQKFVTSFLAKDSKLHFEGDFPQVTTEYLNRYNKSKLVIKDQWASHPSIEERVVALENLNIPAKSKNASPAIELFEKAEVWQTKITDKLFSVVEFPEKATYDNEREFEKAYEKDYYENSFNEIYNGYYDNKNPGQIDLTPDFDNSTDQPKRDIREIFDNETIDMVYSSISLENDIATLQQIKSGEFKAKTYDYDGIKYTAKDSGRLISKLTGELDKLNEKINRKDSDIFNHFYSRAKKLGKENELKERYQAVVNLEQQQKPMIDVYVNMLKSTQFLQFTTPFKIIEQKIYALRKVESNFKEHIQSILKEGVYENELTSEIKDDFKKYLSKTWTYFRIPDYDDQALNIMFTSLHHFNYLILKTYYQQKKELLDFQAQLESEAKMELHN